MDTQSGTVAAPDEGQTAVVLQDELAHVSVIA